MRSYNKGTFPFKAFLLATSLLGGTSLLAKQATATEQQITSLVTAPKQVSERDIAFKELLGEITQDYFAVVPELATFYGVDSATSGEKNAIRLSDYGPSGIKESRKATQDILSRLSAFETTGLNKANLTTRSILRAELANAVEASQTVNYGRLIPGMFRVYQLDQFIGAHTFLLRLLAATQPVTSEAEAHAYIERLSNLPKALSGLADAMHFDAQKGVIPPDFALQKIIASIETAVASPPRENPLVMSFTQKLEVANLDKNRTLADRASDIVSNSVYPAFQSLVLTLKELRSKAVHDAGIWRLPNGEKLYQALIQQQAGTALSADEIHELGLAEVDRISAEMDTILRQENYMEGSVAERMLALSNDTRFLYPNTHAGKADIIAVLNDQMAEINQELPNWFGVLPQDAIEVRQVPAYQEATSASAAYDAPAVDGSRPGIYWINLRDTAMVPIWSVKSDTYHEATPGHHLQISIAQRQANIPLMQNLLSNGAYVEGWALYAEYLAKEMGMYKNDPYGDLGRLRWELHRAVRLVVDTGIHAKRWSREKAISYSMTVGGFDAATAEQEVERYAVLPAQALSYKMGMLKILELRTKAKTELGDAFDIRLFHDAVLLNGPMPMDILENIINNWIIEHRAS